MDRDINSQIAGLGAVYILSLIVSMIIGAFAWPYAINTWLVLLGKEAVCAWWQGALVGLIPVVGRFGLLAALITWVFMLFM